MEDRFEYRGVPVQIQMRAVGGSTAEKHYSADVWMQLDVGTASSKEPHWTVFRLKETIVAEDPKSASAIAATLVCARIDYQMK